MKTYKNIKLASGVKIDSLMVNDNGKGLVRSCKKHGRAESEAAERYLRAEGFIE